MPFRKWAVQPVYLCRSPDPEKKHVTDFDTVYQRSLVHGLRQLANVARLADKIFDELVGECRLAFERTERLRLKVEICHDAVAKLNAKAVNVPVSDLNKTFKFLRRQKPFRTVYEMPTQLFLPSNRPPCVDTLYSEAAVTPVSLICTIDKYRTDGRTSSELFMVTPVLGGATRRKRRKMLDIETRKPASFSLAVQQEFQELGVSEDEVSVPRIAVTSSNGRESRSLDRLPSPEEQTMAISMEYPSTVVQVDTSGFSFLRMAQCRRSLIHADFVIKRKKDKNKSKRRHTVCEGSSKELEVAVQNITMVNTSCQTEASPEPSSFFSLRRSFCRKKSKHTDSTRRETVALDTLDFDSFRKSKGDIASTTDEDKATLKKDSTSSNKKFGKALMSRAANFNPISSLSAALSMAVKMRHSKSGKHDDGRSSSGNWSATSSTRASVDSDQHHIGVMVDRTSNISRNSAGKDSVISDVTQQESIRSQELTLGSNLNYPFKFPVNKPGTEKSNRQWDFDRERGRESNSSTPERSSDCASTPLVMSPYTSRKHNNYPPTAFDDGESSVYSVDTDGYYTSMHTDSGLWHNVIQNLRNGDNILGDSARFRRRQESQSSISTIGNSSINSFLSKTLIENSPNNDKTKQQFKSVPEPPPRSVSCSGTIETIRTLEDVKGRDIHTEEVFDKESSPLKTGSASESDHEAGDRIRVKTTINPSRYPSMCAVSPETSDDDELSDIEKTKPSNISVVVAEVHQEEKLDTIEQQMGDRHLFPPSPAQIYELKKTQRVINMYGNQSPIEFPFESNTVHPSEIVTSTPKQTNSVSSFSTEIDSVDSKTNLNGISNTRRELMQDLELATKNISAIGEDFIITSPPISPKNIPRSVEKTLIPLKYAQRITVTPIVRSETPDNTKQSSSSINSPTTRSKSFLKNPLSNLSFLQTENTKKKSPSYISFQSPDSPVSSSTSLSPVPPMDKSLPAIRAVARVTLDPLGKVIYSSSSLDRPKRGDELIQSVCLNNKEQPKYATLPKYQPAVLHSQAVKSEPKETRDKQTSNLSYSRIPTSKKSIESISFPQNNNLIQNSDHPKTQNLFFRPSRGGRFCRTYFPSHLISSQSKFANNNNLSSPPSPSSSIKSISSTSSQSSHGSKQPIEQIQHNLPSNPPYTCQGLPNQRSISEGNSSPSTTYQPSSVPLFPSRRSSHSPYTSAPSPTRNLAPESQFKLSNTSNIAPSMPFKYQFRPMHFPQEMHATTTHYTTSVPQQHLKFNTLKSPSTMACSELLNKKQLAYSIDDNCKTKFQDNQPSAINFALPNPPDVIPSSSTPPSTLDITSRTVRKKQYPSTCMDEAESSPNNTDVKSMTPKELFAIIHDSKRKLNVKSESEKSSSSHISKSNSSCVMLSSSPIKSPKIETGTFTKQTERFSKIPHLKNSNLNSPDKGTACDRLARTKPTSMHDFKMLLLQTRGGTNESNYKPSAAELLKVSPPKSSSPHQSSPSRPLAKTQNLNQSGFVGHVTIPVKRNMRTRSPYLTRYDSAYPPIWEDCSEELEADENQNQVNYVSNSQSLTKENAYSSNSDNLLNNNKLNPQAASTWV